MSHYNLAMALWARDKGDQDEILASLRESVRLNPTFGLGYFRLALIHLELGENDHAISVLSQLIRVDPDNAQYYLLEEVLARRDGIGAVIAFYQDVLRAQPQNPTLHLRLAKMLRMKGDVEQAETTETEAIRLGRKGYGNTRSIGDYFAEAGKYAEATPWYEATQRENPDDAAVAVRIAFLLRMSGDCQGYEVHCREMLKHFAATSDYIAWRRACWACLLSAPPVGNVDELVQMTEAAVQNAPSDTLALRERGLAAYRAGDWSGALEFCAASRAEFHRDDFFAQNRLIESMALSRQGKLSEARAAFDEAIAAMQRAYPDATGKASGRTEWIDRAYCELLRREAEGVLPTNIDGRDPT